MVSPTRRHQINMEEQQKLVVLHPLQLEDWTFCRDMQETRGHAAKAATRFSSSGSTSIPSKPAASMGISPAIPSRFHVPWGHTMQLHHNFTLPHLTKFKGKCSNIQFSVLGKGMQVTMLEPVMKAKLITMIKDGQVALTQLTLTPIKTLDGDRAFLVDGWLQTSHPFEMNETMRTLLLDAQDLMLFVDCTHILSTYINNTY